MSKLPRLAPLLLLSLQACGEPQSAQPEAAPAAGPHAAAGPAGVRQPADPLLEAMTYCEAFMGFQKSECLENAQRRHGRVLAQQPRAQAL